LGIDALKISVLIILANNLREGRDSTIAASNRIHRLGYFPAQHKIVLFHWILFKLHSPWTLREVVF